MRNFKHCQPLYFSSSPVPAILGALAPTVCSPLASAMPASFAPPRLSPLVFWGVAEDKKCLGVVVHPGFTSVVLSVIWYGMEHHSPQSFQTVSENHFPWVRSIPPALLPRSFPFLFQQLPEQLMDSPSLQSLCSTWRSCADLCSSFCPLRSRGDWVHEECPTLLFRNLHN